MADKKEKKYVSASDGSAVSKDEIKAAKVKEAAPVGSSAGLRAGAIIAWVFAIGFELLAFLVVSGKVDLKFIPQMAQLIIFIVLDLACLILGSQLWKKANHINPMSEKNKALFWLWNNMGVVVAALAFVPFIILLLTNKKIDRKLKIVGIAAAAVALIIGGACSVDYNPVSAEQKAAAQSAIEGTVFWAPFGHVYHTHDDCQALNQTETLTAGDVEQAIAANRTRLCSFCAKRDSITGVATDEIPEEELEAAEE